MCHIAASIPCNFNMFTVPIWFRGRRKSWIGSCFRHRFSVVKAFKSNQEEESISFFYQYESISIQRFEIFCLIYISTISNYLNCTNVRNPYKSEKISKDIAHKKADIEILTQTSGIIFSEVAKSIRPPTLLTHTQKSNHSPYLWHTLHTYMANDSHITYVLFWNKWILIVYKTIFSW